MYLYPLSNRLFKIKQGSSLHEVKGQLNSVAYILCIQIARRYQNKSSLYLGITDVGRCMDIASPISFEEGACSSHDNW